MSGPWRERVEIADGQAVLYLGDCRELLAAGRIPSRAGVVSDPPYGMGWNTNSKRFSGGQAPNNRKRGEGRDDWAEIAEDAEPFDPAPWLAFPHVVLWGANHFGARLPVGTTLIWVKKAPHLWGTFLSDAEVGWRKGGHGVYVRQVVFPPTTRANEGLDGRLAHPTQKPVDLMAWCLGMTEGTVVDPYMGSGTTGVACARLGRRFIGIEKVEAHFRAAVRRVADAYAQPGLLIDPPEPKRGAGAPSDLFGGPEE